MSYRHIVVKQLSIKELNDEFDKHTACVLFFEGRVFCVYNESTSTIMSEMYHDKRNAANCREQWIDDDIEQDCDCSEY